MGEEVEDDVAIDVLVVGAGIQGLAVAHALRGRYSVWVAGGPTPGSETLDGHGYLDAGYGATEVERASAARRAVGVWRSWFEQTQVPHDLGPRLRAVPSDRVSALQHRWSEVGLPATEIGAPPLPFYDGVLGRQHWFETPDDAVADPAAILCALRQGIGDRILDAEVTRFGIFGDGTLDHVELRAADVSLVVVPRFVVLCAGAGNATLLGNLASRFSSSPTRIARRDAAVRSQATRVQTTVCVRGDLPLISGRFADVTITAHRSGDETVWLVALDRAAPARLGPWTGPPPQPDGDTVATAVTRLFALAPSLRKRAEQLAWSSYATVRAVAPELALGGTVSEPAPPRLDRFGLSDAFFALWPSNLSQAAVLADVATEQIAQVLGRRSVGDDGARPWEVARPRLPGRKARWDHPDHAWATWKRFQAHPLAST